MRSYKKLIVFSAITLKIIHDKIIDKKKNLPKIENFNKIEKKMSKINNEKLKKSLDNFLKAYNAKND